MKINNKTDFYAWADKFIKKQLSSHEEFEFESFCENNPEYKELFQEHQRVVQELKAWDRRKKFQDHLKEVSINQGGKVRSFKAFSGKLQEYITANIAVAATIAIVSVFSTLWISGYYSNLKKTNSDYSALRREMNSVKRNVNAQNAVIKNIRNVEKEADQQYGATGFVISSKGYVITNYHVISGADSIYLQNSEGESFKSEVVYKDELKDLAVLNVLDTLFSTPKDIPYTFKTSDTDLGEQLYTLGFPRDEAVYGQGYLSSSTGYGGDTVSYQISIPVNPGNSGGPVLDKNGNLIGIISGKQTGIDGAAFAIKTKTLLEVLEQAEDPSLMESVQHNNKNLLAHLSRTDQVKELAKFVYLVKVF